MNSDVLIIGSGVIGLTIARSLHRKGVQSITIFERGKIGREASFAAAGMLAPQSESASPGPMFDICCESRDLYPQFANELLEETGIDIELEQTGTLVPAFSEEDAVRQGKIFAWQTAAGLDVKKLSADEMLQRERLLSPKIISGLYFRNDWQVNNRRLVAALAEYTVKNSIKVVEDAPVDELLIDGTECIGIRSQGIVLNAKTVIVATGAWTSLMNFSGGILPVNIEPVRGQMIAFLPPEPSFRNVIFSSDVYIVPRRNGKLVVGSTVEHCGFDDHTTAEGIEKLRASAINMAPFLVDIDVYDSWSGLRPKARDDLPVLGRFTGIDELFIATAHFRNGILLAPLSGELVAESVVSGRSSQYLDVFSPERTSLMWQKAV